MSQTPDILFHSQLPQKSLPILVRNSDDFFPEIPTSHPWHIFVNAYNALFTQHLNVIPDWDMFQTVHEYSGFHAAARCVSGGPIYVTDVPGEHDFDLLAQMSGTTTKGKTIIFRTSVVGKTLDAYNGYDDDALLLVGAYHGKMPISSIVRPKTKVYRPCNYWHRNDWVLQCLSTTYQRAYPSLQIPRCCGSPILHHSCAFKWLNLRASTSC